MSSEFKRLIRYANIALAVTIPVLIAGAILLRNASEGVLQAFALVVFFFGLAIIPALDERNKRRQRG